MNESLNGEIVAPMVNIGKRIKRLREIVPGRTQAEFAVLLGVSRGAVGNWEVGKGVKRENLLLIARETGASVEWLLNGPDDGPVPISGPPQVPLHAAGGLFAAAVEEALLAVGLSAETASEIVAKIMQVLSANPPGFEDLSAEETTRMIVRRLVEAVLVKRRGF